jgi:hypothetical protein
MSNEGTEKKPGVKIQDLSPKKDAKGGVGGSNPNTGKGGFDPNMGKGGLDPNKGPVDPNSFGSGNDN